MRARVIFVLTLFGPSPYPPAPGDKNVQKGHVQIAVPVDLTSKCLKPGQYLREMMLDMSPNRASSWRKGAVLLNPRNRVARVLRVRVTEARQ